MPPMALGYGLWLSDLGSSSPLARLRTYFTDATLSAIYQSSIGVTVGAGVVSQWNDARGATGFAPSLIGTGTAKPAYAVGADGIPTMTFDGVDDALSTSATSALFDVSGALSLVLIGAVTQQAGPAYSLGISSGSSATRFLGIWQPGGGTATLQVFGGPGAGINANSGVLVSNTRRLVIASKNAGTGVSVDVPAQARATGTGSASASGNNGLTIGNYFGANANFAKPVVVAALVIARQVTAADIVQLQAFAASLNYVAA